MNVGEKVKRCAELADDYKAEQIIMLNLEGMCSYTDYFIICSGRSTRQVQGIADHIEQEMKKHGIRPLGIEGFQEGHWVLMDYDDVIVHIFYEPIREIYDLESLWADAKTEHLSRAHG